MVTFQIDHPDFNNEPSIISLYFDKFLIGSNNRCQLRFPDEDNIIYLKAVLLNDKFIIESLDDHFYILNGKKYKGTLKCNEGDVVILGMATITIKKIDLENTFKGIDFKATHKEFAQHNRELSQVMKALQNELIFSDQEKL
jgi:translation initiation factor IF-1